MRLYWTKRWYVQYCWQLEHICVDLLVCFFQKEEVIFNMSTYAVYSEAFYTGCPLRVAFNFSWYGVHLKWKEKFVWLLWVVFWAEIIRRKPWQCCFPEWLGLGGWWVIGLFAPVPNPWATKLLNQGNHLLDLRPCNIAALFFSENLKQRVTLLASLFPIIVHSKAQRSKGKAFKSRKMLFYDITPWL